MDFKLCRNNVMAFDMGAHPSKIVDGALCLDCATTEKKVYQSMLSRMPDTIKSKHIVAIDKFSADLTYKAMNVIKSIEGGVAHTETLTLFTNKGFIRFKVTVGLFNETRAHT